MIKNTLKALLGILLFMCACCTLAWAQEETPAALPAVPPTPPAQTPIALDANRVENIYCAAGVVTSIDFITEKSIDTIKIGSPIAEVKFDPERKIMDIFPKVQSGRTNMNVVVDGTTYVFVLEIVTDQRIDYRRTFTFAREAEAGDSAMMSKAPHLKPGEIDVVGAIAQIKQASTDAVLRSKLPFYRTRAINKIYQWNGNLIYLVEGHQFVDRDLVVLKIQWLNEQNRAFYIKDRQYEVWLANKQIPVTARIQATDGTVFPGQMETVWLFVQGYRLSLNNPWELKLPPEADAIRQLMK